MPEVIEDPKTKEKKLIDWMGRPISSAQEAEQKRTTSYLYDMYHLGSKLRNMTDPNKRGDNLADLQKNLQAQYYGREGLAGDYVKGASDLAVEKSRDQAARDVADISGRYQVEATKAGVVPPNSDLMSLAERLLGDKTDPTKIKLAGDKDAPAVVPTLGAPNVEKEKKKKEAEVQKRLGVIPLPGTYAESEGASFGGVSALWKSLLKQDPDKDSWKRDAFR